MRRWRYFILTLLFVIGLLGLDLSLTLRPSALRARLDKMLTDNLTTPVVYDSIDVEIGGWVSVKGIRVLAEEGSEERLFEAENVTLRLNWLDLLAGELEIQEVVLDRPVMHLKWDADGNIDLPSFLKSPDTKARSPFTPTISIRGLSVVSHNTPQIRKGIELRLQDIDVELSPTRSRVYRYGIEGEINDPEFGRFVIDGSIGSAYLRGSLTQHGFRLDGDSAFVNLLSKEQQEDLGRLRMEGSADLEVRFDSKDFHQAVDINGSVKLAQVSLGYEGWPDEIRRLNGTLRYRAGELTCDDADFDLAGGHVSIAEASIVPGAEASDFVVRGQMSGLYLGRSFAAGLDKYPDPGPTIRQVLDALDAEGTVDIGFRLQSNHDLDRVDVDCNVTFREATLCYKGFVDEDGTHDGFPYPMERVIGSVRITNDDAVFHDIRSLMKLPNLKAAGRVVWGKDVGAGFDIKISGSAIQLEEKIAKCLTPADRALYEAFDPDGPVRFDLELHRDETEVAETEIELTVGLTGVHVRCEWFPYDLEDAEGDLVFGTSGGCRIRDVRARHGSGSILLSGNVAPADAHGETAFDIDVEAEGLFVDKEFLDALSTIDPGVPAAIDPFNLSGEIALQASISSTTEGVSNRMHINLREGSFAHRDFPQVRFTGVNGDIFVTDDHVELQGIEMDWQGNAFNVHGTASIGGEATHDIWVEAPRLQLKPEVMDIAEGLLDSLSSFKEDISVEGDTHLDLHFLANTAGSAVKTRLRPRGVTLQGTNPHFLIKGITGDVEILGDQATFRNWNGELALGSEANAPHAKLSISDGQLQFGDSSTLALTGIMIKNLILTDAVMDLLPGELGDDLKESGWRGSMDANLDVLEVTPKGLLLTGVVNPLQLAMGGTGVEVQGARLKVDQLRHTEDGFQLNGTLRKGLLSLGEIKVKDLGARVSCQGDELLLSAIRGEFYGGRLNHKDSEVRIELNESAPFSAKISVTGSQIDEILGATLPPKGRRSPRGAVNLGAELGGRLSDFATWDGHGELNLKGEGLYELPFFAVVLNILNLDFLDGRSQTGEVAYRIKDSQIVLDRARLEGPGVNLDGTGVIGFDGLCDITFDIEALKVLEGIPILGNLVSLGRGLFVDAVRVQGPIEDLKASVENFLVNAEQDSGRRLKVKGLKLKTTEAGVRQ